MVIGLPSGAKAEELDHQDIHEKFVKKLAQVTTQMFECRYFIHCSLKASMPNSKVDPRLLHEAYQLLVKTNEKKAPRK